MSLRETTILIKELLSDGAVTVANVIGKLGADDDHVSVASAATDGMFCIIQQTSTAAEQSMRLVLEGIADLKYGDTVTRGNLLTADASGYGIPAVTGNNIVGIALVSGVANDIGSCLVSPQILPSAAGVDGHSFLHVATATYEFAVDGGAVGDIALGVTIPDTAIIVDGLMDILVACVSNSNDGEIALKTNTGGDLLAAVDADSLGSGLVALIPVGTAATCVKMTAARELTLTVSVNDLTAGKIIFFVQYIMSI